MTVGPPFAAGGAERLVFLFEAAIGADGVAENNLVADNGQQARVVPRLGHEIAGSAAHGLYGDVDTDPRGHDDDGQGGVDGREFLE